MKKVDLKKQRKLQNLLDSSYQLFTTQGIVQTTISDIVRHAGIAKGTFYLYFRNKEDVLNQLLAYKFSQLLRRAAQETIDNHVKGAENRIVYLSNSLIEQLSGDRRLLDFLARNLSSGMLAPDINSAVIMDLHTYLLQDEPVRFNDPDIMFFMITTLISNSCVHSLLSTKPPDTARLRPYLLKTIRDIVHHHIAAEETKDN